MQEKLSTKDIIIKNAVKLFYELGYEKTTLRKIAAESGFSHVALFSYFKTKGELASVILERYFMGLTKITKEFINREKSDTQKNALSFLYYWGIHYKMLISDEYFSRFFFEFYKNEQNEFVKTTLKHGTIIMHKLFNIQYKKNEIDTFLDFSAISSIDIILAHLCFENKITINKSVKYLYNFISSIQLHNENISYEEIDDFIAQYIDTRNPNQYNIYEDFLKKSNNNYN